MTAFPNTRTASAWPAPSKPPSTATSRPPTACNRDSSPGSTARRRRATGHRVRRTPIDDREPEPSRCEPSPPPIAVLTGEYGAAVLEPLLRDQDPPVRLIPVHNGFFGGNIAVTGLMTGADIARALRHEPAGQRYLLPDVCLSEGRFLDGTTVAELPLPVEVIPSDGYSLRLALESPAAPRHRPEVGRRRSGSIAMSTPAPPRTPARTAGDTDADDRTLLWS